MKSDTKLIKVLACAVLALWGGSWYFLSQLPYEERGTFGDMFGAVNALFSGFAFLGVIYAILLQRTELSLQRQELSMTRTELSKSAKAQELSEKALSNQAKSMEITATISALTASISSLEKRIALLPTSGYESEIKKNELKVKQLTKQLNLATAKLDEIMSELLSE